MHPLSFEHAFNNGPEAGIDLTEEMEALWKSINSIAEKRYVDMDIADMRRMMRNGNISLADLKILEDDIEIVKNKGYCSEVEKTWKNMQAMRHEKLLEYEETWLLHMIKMAGRNLDYFKISKEELESVVYDSRIAGAKNSWEKSEACTKATTSRWAFITETEERLQRANESWEKIDVEPTKVTVAIHEAQLQAAAWYFEWACSHYHAGMARENIKTMDTILGEIGLTRSVLEVKIGNKIVPLTDEYIDTMLRSKQYGAEELH